VNSTVQTTPRLLGFELTANRIRTLGVKSGLSIVDQGLVSGAGFLLSFLLARWLNSEIYGAFAVAFATLLFLSGFHNILLLEPMSVMGPARYSDRTPLYFAAQLQIHEMMGALLAGVLLLIALVMKLLGVNHELVTSTAGSAVALPFFLMLWLARRMAYMVHRPAVAGTASLIYFLLTLFGLLVLHASNILSPATAFLLMGGAGLLSTALPMWQLGMLGAKANDPIFSKACSWRAVAKENWNYGRWLVLSTALFSVAAQGQTYLAAGLLGLGAAGIFRAMQVPSLVMTQIVTGVGLLVLPSMSREFGLGRLSRMRREAVLASAFVTLIGLGYAAILVLFAVPIEHLLYGGKYSPYVRLIPILGLVPVCTGLALGFSMAVRASQKPHIDLVANAVSAPVGLITAAVFIKLWGLSGAALSLVAGFAVYAAVFCWSFRKMPRVLETEELISTLNSERCPKL
jgi:O-antigen/teichoic acid export membrane protein